MFNALREDIDAYLARDPAARSPLEVALLYPGFHARTIHRLSGALWRNGFRLLGRLLSQFGRFMTGVEIHPGAIIGRRLVIDHGAGVVIGETAEIGEDVTIYQGVTLGGTSPAVNSSVQVGQKRHPTIRDRVIIGSGAQVLGPIVIGEGARIGANSVVTKDIPPGVTAIGIPAQVVMPKDRAQARAFVAYGTPEGCPDPILMTIEGLRTQVAGLKDRVEELESELRAERAGKTVDGGKAS
ncbi:MAG: serine O-acetyltransferase [Alphaproteobacteria bacterium]|nr:serine O-acetyltransferase [Alphaproteobacteria bacterium]